MNTIFTLSFTKRTVVVWMPFALLASLLSGIVYISIQQSIRLGANDEPVQIAEDVTTLLNAGNQPQAIIPATSLPIDMAKSLAIYIIIYDNTGKPLASTVQLNNTVPVPPSTVFDYVSKNGEDRITWQPQAEVRSAAIISQYKSANGSQSGFVISGRSLREIEILESLILRDIVIGWAVTLIVLFVLLYLLVVYKNTQKMA